MIGAFAREFNHSAAVQAFDDSLDMESAAVC